MLCIHKQVQDANHGGDHAAVRPSSSAPRIHAGGRVVASPYARRLAEEAGADVGLATGTGPGGRIVAADVQKLIASGGGQAQPQAAGAQAASPQVCHADGLDAGAAWLATGGRQLRSCLTSTHAQGSGAVTGQGSLVPDKQTIACQLWPVRSSGGGIGR